MRGGLLPRWTVVVWAVLLLSGADARAASAARGRVVSLEGVQQEPAAARIGRRHHSRSWPDISWKNITPSRRRNRRG
jgi:hypothetical protein